MRYVWRGLLAVALVLAAMIAIGWNLPDTPQSVAQENCDKLKRTAYTARERALVDDACGEMMRQADLQNPR